MENLFFSRRSIRFYKQDLISDEDISFILNAARLSPSAMNLQPLKFVVVRSEEYRERLFPLLRWAGYVKPKRIPPEGKRPTAYVVVCSDDEISVSPYIPYDVGGAVNAMLLAARFKGIGSCWLGAIDKDGIKEVLSISPSWSVHCVVSLGLPDEEPVVETMSSDVRYFLDDKDVLHVPKRPLEEIVRFV